MHTPRILLAVLVLSIPLLSACNSVLGLETWQDLPTGDGGPPSREDQDPDSDGGPGGRDAGLCVEAPDAGQCGDCQKNGEETDIDCGGPVCPACPTGKHCNIAEDCANGACLDDSCH